jgi:hypothetical protein
MKLDPKNIDAGFLEIARHLGEPINPKLPAAFELDLIADILPPAKPGEKIWKFSAFRSANDICLQVDAAGALTQVKRTPTGDAEMTFIGLDSKEEYVLLDDILAEEDNVGVLADRKASITRSMDKRELSTVLNAILSKTAGYLPGVDPEEVTVASGADLYKKILEMKHKAEDYGDKYVLLCGTTLYEAIDDYEIDKAGSHNYNVTGGDLLKRLRRKGIEPVKVFGNVELTDGGGETAVMPATKAVLVAQNSRIAEGKPIKVVRRMITPEIARLMGGEGVDNRQRMLWTKGIVNKAGVTTLGYSVFGYESIIFTIVNPKAVVFADFDAIV